jgi:hypothetical protein
VTKSRKFCEWFNSLWWSRSDFLWVVNSD